MEIFREKNCGHGLEKIYLTDMVEMNGCDS